MHVTEPLPPTIDRALAEAAGPNPNVRIAFASDIDHTGRFGEEWLVVTEDRLRVFATNDKSAELVHEIRLDSIRSARVDTRVGSGVLEIQLKSEHGGGVIQALRFSNAISDKAHAAVRALNALANGEEPNPQDLDEPARCATCGRLLPEEGGPCPACINKRAVMLRLFRFLAPYKLQAAAGLAVIVGITSVELVTPWVGGRIVDILARSSGPQTGQAGAAMSLLITLVGILIGVRVASAIFQYAQRRLNSFIGARTLMDIRLAIFERYNLLSLSYYDKRATGSLMSRVTNDADNLWDFLMDGMPFFLTNIVTLIGTSIVLFRMNWRLAALLLTPGPLLFGLTRWFLPRARVRFRLVHHRISRMNSALSSALNGMRVIKAFAQEQRENAKFGERNRQVFEASYNANAMWAIYTPALALLMALGSWIIWLYGGSLVLHREMTLGTLTAFAGYLMQFYAPFQNFTRALDWSTRSLTAAERVFEVLDTQPDVQPPGPQSAVHVPKFKGEVEFRHVSFGYDKNKRVLEDFTLCVEPGEMIGLVGHSGAGKSTIINLLSRFYDVDEGAILIDGVDIRHIAQEDLRSQLGIVLQEPFLFPGSIRDNIAYAKPDATSLEIMRAAKAANCHEFILKFPDGYDTFCGERGQRLSGGERQRISIARAILHDPRILILDEATASVDTETEKQIQEAIARLIENRTTFAIAHRLSTLRNADRLVVMKDGKIAEIGTHDELMERDGVYAGLVKVQTELNRIRAA